MGKDVTEYMYVTRQQTLDRKERAAGREDASTEDAQADIKLAMIQADSEAEEKK